MDLDDILVRLRYCLYRAEQLPDVWSHLCTASRAVELAKEKLEKHVAEREEAPPDDAGRKGNGTY